MATAAAGLALLVLIPRPAAIMASMVLFGLVLVALPLAVRDHRQHVDITAVAIVDSSVAGFVMVVGDEVEQVYVSAERRGLGVADVLLAEAERRVRDGGHDEAWLAVVAGNARARRFYERQGWTDRGLFDHAAPNEAGPITVPAHRYVKRVA